MPAEVTWNGIAKSYRVGKYNFVQNRTQIIDDDEVIAYLKNQRHFTVIDKAPAPKKAAAAKPAAAPAPAEPEATSSDESTDEKKPSRGPRTRRGAK